MDITMLTLQDTQLLTRYYQAEKPYWMSFVNHYESCGVTMINVCVQSEEDQKSVLSFSYSANINLNVFILDKHSCPDSALKKFNFRAISHQRKYTLLADCDEFLTSQTNKQLTLDEFFDPPRISSLQVQWLMDINYFDSPNFENFRRYGFWGRGSKPIALSNSVLAINTVHHFRIDDRVRSNQLKIRDMKANLSMSGVVLVHAWARSFKDCLIKLLYSKLKDEKTHDQNLALAKLRCGHLPNRLKMLALLKMQESYIEIPPYKYHIDTEAEDSILSRYITQSDIEFFEQVFNSYLEDLKTNNFSQIYPLAKGNLQHALAFMP